MNCETFEQHLEAFLSGDLAPLEQTEVEEHLGACTHCQALFNRATRMDGLLRDELRSAIAMTAKEQAILREAILRKAQHRPSLRRRLPHLTIIASMMTIAITVSLSLLWAKPVPAVSAAEILTRAQDAMDRRADLNAVLHWETTLEQWFPDMEESYIYEMEIWLDFDDPGRYHVYYKLEEEFDWGEVRNGVDRFWKYSSYPNPYTDEFILSPEEMQLITKNSVPSPFRDELDRFADILPDVKVVGESTMAGRRVYLLRGELPTGRIAHDGQPHTVNAVVTLFVDAETYWLLGRKEFVQGEERPRMQYQTVRFDLIPPDQVADTVFTLTSPEGVNVRQINGLDPGYRNLTVPYISLEEAADAAPFVILLPTTLPADLEMQPVATIEPHGTTAARFTQLYSNVDYGWMFLEEYEWLSDIGFAGRPVDIDGKQGWVRHDLIYADVFTITLVQQNQEETTKNKPLPRTVVLTVRGYSLNEAINALNSLKPYEP
jgi:hypothetical protein